MCAEEIVICNAVFRSTNDDVLYRIVPQLFAIKLPNCPKFSPNFDVSGDHRTCYVSQFGDGRLSDQRLGAEKKK